MSTTGDKILTYFQNRPELDLKREGGGRYRANSPFRHGSDSSSFTFIINPDGEHGAYRDYNPKGQAEKGSLYDLAARLGIERSPNGKLSHPTTKRAYKDLADYAAAHGVTAQVFEAAGWSQTTHKGRPALLIKTDTGARFRFLDGNEPPYLHAKGYRRCWYRLTQAVDLAAQTGQPLVICNGEASTVVAQFYGLAATAVTSGSEKATLPGKLLEQLKTVYAGPVMVAFDCDPAGQTAAPKLAQFLAQAGFQAKAVDLALSNGQDLADFCRLHTTQAAAKLQALKEITPSEPTKDPDAKLKSADYLQALKSLGYFFRLNVLDDTVEVNEEPLTDILTAQIRTRMRDVGFTKYLTAMEDAYTTAAADNPYHPIKAYLESLNYDGVSHIDTLTAYFKDEHGVFGLWLKKFLVGATAKIYEPVQNPMLVLDGPQGKGKSYLVAWLCPLPKFFLESPIQPENNDHKLLLATTWLWEVSELGATTRKADREALKAFISQQWVKARKPYGKRPISKPAMASFIGTVNNEAGFLNDSTGSRRFLTCTLTQIDWGYTRLNQNDIWAEAYHLYKSGYDWRLTTDEQARQAEINEEYEIIDPWCEEILRYYRVTGRDDDFQASRDILERLGIDPKEKKNTMRLAQVMKKFEPYGVKKYRSTSRENRVHGYTGFFLLR